MTEFSRKFAIIAAAVLVPTGLALGALAIGSDTGAPPVRVEDATVEMHAPGGNGADRGADRDADRGAGDEGARGADGGADRDERETPAGEDDPDSREGDPSSSPSPAPNGPAPAPAPAPAPPAANPIPVQPVQPVVPYYGDDDWDDDLDDYEDDWDDDWDD